MAPGGRLTRFEWACLGVVVAAFAFRAYFIFHPYVIWDTAWYLLLARSFGTFHDFRLPWTDPLQYSGYWPPLFPILASPLVKLFGASYGTIVLAACLMSLALTVAALLTTWDLYGRARGFAAMATVAATPAFIHSDSSGMSESTLALMVLLALWAFLKSLKRPLWLAPAAALALLAYFAKPNLGLPLVIAALLPLAAWRVHKRGWRAVARSPLDITAAAAVVLALVAFGATRSGKLGGIGVGIIDPIKQALSYPLFVPFLLFKFVFASVFLLVVTLPFSLRVRRSLRDAAQDEARGYLLIFVVLTLMATALFTASFLITEHRGPLTYGNVVAAFTSAEGQGFAELAATISHLVDFDNIRYLTPALVPFLWLVLPAWPLEDDAPEQPVKEGAKLRRRHFLWLTLAVASAIVVMLLNPLAGVGSLTRLVWFVVLSLVPLGFAWAAWRAHYAASTKRTAKGAEETRLVPAAPKGFASRRALVAFCVVLALAGYFYSSWFLCVAVALLVALAARSPRAVVVGLAAIMLVSTWPPYVTPYPVEQASAYLHEHLPPGARVASTDPIPYFAAVAPGDIKLRFLNDPDAPRGFDAIVLTHSEALQPATANYTRVAAWNYTFDLFPTFWLRLQIEHGLLAQDFDFPEQPGLAVYLPNASSSVR